MVAVVNDLGKSTASIGCSVDCGGDKESEDRREHRDGESGLALRRESEWRELKERKIKE